MKATIIFVAAMFIATCAYTTGAGTGGTFRQSVESRIRKFTQHKWPDNPRMQKHEYDEQLSPYKYMRTVKDAEAKRIVLRKWPDDYVMQKYDYKKQLSARQYMNALRNSTAKSRAQRQWPDDYAWQKQAYKRTKKFAMAKLILVVVIVSVFGTAFYYDYRKKRLQ